MSPASRAVSGAALALLAACGPGGGSDTPPPPESAAGAARADTVPTSASVELRTDRTAYRAGDRLTLTLVNGSDARFSFNPCTRQVQRESGGSWAAVPEPDRVCTMEAWLLEPRGTRSGETELPGALEPGRYRIVVALVREDATPAAARELAVSAPITVAR